MADKYRVMIKSDDGKIRYSANWMDTNPIVTTGELAVKLAEKEKQYDELLGKSVGELDKLEKQLADALAHKPVGQLIKKNVVLENRIVELNIQFAEVNRILKARDETLRQVHEALDENTGPTARIVKIRKLIQKE